MKTLATIHASMTPPSKNLTFRDIDLRDRRYGYMRVGYHYVIERDGKTTAGRAPYEPSMHDSLRDADRAISFCLVGGVDAQGEPDNNFTEAQWSALFDTIRSVAEEMGRPFTEVRAETPAVETHWINRKLWKPRDLSENWPNT
jgi:hypothetical protein